MAAWAPAHTKDTDGLDRAAEQRRRIAVVGCSGTPGKAAHDIPRLLRQRGWEILPVNPSHDELLGERCYETLGEVPGTIDLVDVFRPADEAPEIARQAAKVGAGGLWLQLGIVSADARRIAKDAGLAFVEDDCAGALAQAHDLHPRSG